MLSTYEFVQKHFDKMIEEGKKGEEKDFLKLIFETMCYIALEARSSGYHEALKQHNIKLPKMKGLKAVLSKKSLNK
jgi:hypothetical protein